MKVRKKRARARRGATARAAALICFFAAGALAPGCSSPAPGDSPTAAGRGELLGQARPRAVLLVVADTTRADFVSFNGHWRETTPYLDRLADDGVVFDNAYAPSSWTLPSVASLFTSLHPKSHGVVVGGFRDQVERTDYVIPHVPRSLETMAETFQRAGFRTIGAAANRFLAAETGFGQGFDQYYNKARYVDADVLDKIAIRRFKRAFGGDWRETWRESPTFVWLHYFDPHSPYMAREPWIDEFADDYRRYPDAYPVDIKMPALVRRYPSPDLHYRECALPLYESEIAFFDKQFKRIAKKLDVARGDVLVIFTSDHGEEFADHDDIGHSHTLYEELVRVPLLVYWPDGLRGGRRIDAPVSLLDVFPTLTELIGVPAPAGAQGRSLVPLLRGEPGDPERPLLFEIAPPRPDKQALRRGRWKLIRSAGAEAGIELYDLARDPGERTDLAAREPELVARLVAELDAMRARLPDASPAESSVVADPELLEQLRNMGYVEAEEDENDDEDE